MFAMPERKGGPGMARSVSANRGSPGAGVSPSMDANGPPGPVGVQASAVFSRKAPRMKLGVVYPQIELGGDTGALLRFGQAAEDLGYRHIVLYDHLVGSANEQLKGDGNPYTERDPFHDPMVAFAFLAGVTRSIELVTGILILPQRQTVLLAKQATDVDLMSGGRLRLGVGAGYSPAEFAALGIDFASRGRRLNEQIPYLRRLWREERISFAGEYHQLDDGNIVPRPARDIPIWCGGFSEPAYRRAARLADGFIFGYGLTPLAANGWERVREQLAREQRDPATFGAHFLLHPPESPYSHEEIVEGLHRLGEAGATDVSLYTMGRGFTGVEQHIAYLAEIKERIDASGVAHTGFRAPAGGSGPTVAEPVSS